MHTVWWRRKKTSRCLGDANGALAGELTFLAFLGTGATLSLGPAPGPGTSRAGGPFFCLDKIVHRRTVGPLGSPSGNTLIWRWGRVARNTLFYEVARYVFTSVVVLNAPSVLLIMAGMFIL